MAESPDSPESGRNESLSAAGKIAAELRRRLIARTYPPESYLPSLPSLAEEFRASCSTVSDALAELAEAGLVKRSRGRGTRVLPATRQERGIVITRLGAHLDIDRGTSASEIIHGAREGLTLAGHECRIESFEEMNYSADVVYKRHAGAIFVGGMIDPTAVRQLQERGFPVVVANLECDLDVSATYVDHEHVVRQAVELLAGLGHRRIALLEKPPDTFFYGQAERGYTEALKEQGLPYDRELICVLKPVQAHQVLQSYFAARRLLALPDPPTAFVTARDNMAEGVCVFAEEAGLKLGRDVSVIGFDDCSWLGGREFLTTFREPRYELGATAAQLLIERMIHGGGPVQKRKLEAPLVMRRTAGPVPSATPYMDGQLAAER
jgi:DNA-binding LacI/PurR family transcriptional regulator